MAVIYLAGAIDRAMNDPRMWSREMRDMLLNIWTGIGAEKGIAQPLIVYAPALAFGIRGDLDQTNARAVWNINMTALDMCTVLLVRYELGQETWGTPQEVYRAVSENIPVIVWTPQHLWVDSGGILPPYLAAHAYKGICCSGMVNAAKQAVELVMQQYRNQSNDNSRTIIQRVLDLSGHQP